MKIALNFSIEELETMRQSATLNAVKIGLQYAKNVLDRRTKEYYDYAKTLDCGTQDARAEDVSCMYYRYMDYCAIREKITRAFVESGVEIVTTHSDIVFQGVENVVNNCVDSAQYDKMFNIMLDSYEAMLNSIQN